MSRVRTAFNKNQLSKEKIEQLNTYNFIWNQKDQNWEDGFNCYKDYVLENGSAHVKASYKCKKHTNRKGEAYPLGTWVSFQRGPQAKLSENRISRLNDLGFIWDFFEK